MIGRGNESELRVNDISVSRRHAMLKLKKDDGFYLADNNSKFGTVVLVRHKLSLSPNYQKAVQIGRTIINFCVRPRPPLEYKTGDYIKQNKEKLD